MILEADDDPATGQTLIVNGQPQRHNVCPAGNVDWLQFEVTAGQTYVLRTLNLEFAADTVLELYEPDGTTRLAQNDDYGYTNASRIVWQPTVSGVHFARVRHHNAAASGPNTGFDVVLQEGYCSPDAQEGDTGDNGPGDAHSLATDGSTREHNICADPLRPDVGDQDWSAFEAVAGGTYEIRTGDLRSNSDTVIEIYDVDGQTLLQRRDDAGEGRSTIVQFEAETAGTYFVRVLQYNTNVTGSETRYQLSILGSAPPTPTPTPTSGPTPVPPPAPSPAPPNPSDVQTLIVVNRAQFVDLYGEEATETLMTKLYTLADHDSVRGAVLQVEQTVAVAEAYATWTASADSQLDNSLANDVASAVRNVVHAFLADAPSARYIVLVGDDRMLPHRREAEGDLTKQESEYAPEVSPGTTVAAALAADLTLTDDFYADRKPSQWRDRRTNSTHPLYLADYAIGRLIETPEEIGAFIDGFLGGDQQIETQRVLVSGYDFVQDSAEAISFLFKNDTLTTDHQIVGPAWPGSLLRTKHLSADPRFDLHSINGHSTHLTTLTPDGQDIGAADIAASTALNGVLVFAAGCHAGLNDPGQLDLPQAYLRQQATYVGNTGFGWGSGGKTYSEALMLKFARELLRDTSAEIGPSLSAAKAKYWSHDSDFDAFDAKVLMGTTLYGLPMLRVTSGGTLSDDDPFPSAQSAFDAPSSLGDGPARGSFQFLLPGSFGAFNESNTERGRLLTLDGTATYEAGTPVQPRFFADVSSPAAGTLRGALFLGGRYRDEAGVDPVVALAENEYVLDKREPTLEAEGWYPALPLAARGADGVGILGEAGASVVLTLGQYHVESGTQRLFEQVSLDTYYSFSADREAATVRFVDGVLDGERGSIKLETTDASGIARVVVAHTNGGGVWESTDLTFDTAAQKWRGTVENISASGGTVYFVQIVDGAGNVAVADNKGHYYRLLPPLPLREGQPLEMNTSIFLPLVSQP